MLSRLTGMRKLISTWTAMVIALSACAADNPGGSGERDGDVATVMALSLRQLVTVDTTFGVDHRFTELLVLTSTDPGAGDGSGSARPLSAQERDAIEDALRDVGPVRWIDDPDEFRTADLMPVIEGSAIVGVGEPRFDDEGALVPVSLWCGGLCGTWFSYRVVEEDGEWLVVGPEGPIAVS